MKTLPSEGSQYLANYLREHMWDFLRILSFDDEPKIDPQALSKTIQDFWDSLL